MPDAHVLELMYGSSYAKLADETSHCDSPKQPERVLAWLRDSVPGTFVDYGCGFGELLGAATAIGWQAWGVEFTDEAARTARAHSGLQVLQARALQPDHAGSAEVLHLGDVVEHMTDPVQELGAALGLLKPGGVLLAQGPLEGNLNLFVRVLRLGRRWRRAQPATIPPYHVLLATGAGQRALFERVGLATLAFEVTEVAWPAPDHLTRAVAATPRLAVLYMLRKASRLLTRVMPPRSRAGNRYFFAGKSPVSV
jgi:SAM-dependent methyltransferase